MAQRLGEYVSLERHGAVAVVIFDRAPHNFVSVQLITEIADALAAADAMPDVRAMVLCSEGKSFSAGAELTSTTDTVAAGMDGMRALYAQAMRLFELKKPVVAAVQGAAVGAGLGLAIFADFRVATPEARFCANFVKLAFHPGFGLTHVLPHLVGPSRAGLMLLTGRRIKPEDGLAWGLVDQISDRANLRSDAIALATELSESGPLAVLATRKTLRSALVEDVRAQMEIEIREQTALRGTADFAEGVRAVAERRPGRFVSG
jgi:enoyl-CoA hydratase/carnithine racemase